MADTDLLTTIGIGVEVKTDKAIRDIDKLVAALKNIGSAKGALIPKSVVTRLSELGSAMDKFRTTGNFNPSAALKNISSAIHELSQAKGANIPKNVAPRIEELGKSIQTLEGVNTDKFQQVVDTLKQMRELSDLKLPKVTGVKGLLNATSDSAPKMDDVKKESKEATDSLDDFNDGLEETRHVMDEVDAAIQKTILRFSDFTLRAIIPATSAVAKFAGAITFAPWKHLATSIASATKRLTGFLAALKRVAIYRAIRSALKHITQGFKEGMQNLYQYSLLIDGKFKDSMDSLATSALYLKNSLGAMVAPIVNALAPAVDILVDKFVDLLNTINELIATLTGASTWTKALKYPTQYADAMDGAAGSAKKLRATLLGFDEINRLDDNSRGSRGSASDLLDYSKMFEEQGVSSYMQNLVQRIREAFRQSDLTNLGEDIGEAIRNGLSKINWQSIKTKMAGVATSFATLINGIVDVPALGRTIGSSLAQAINAGVNTLYTFFTTVDWKQVGKFVGDGINGFTEDFDADRLGRSFAATFNAGIGSLLGMVQSVKWENLGKFIADGINGFFSETNMHDLGVLVSDGILGAIQMVETILKQTDFDELGRNIGEFIKGIDWKAILGGLGVVLVEALKAALTTAGALILTDPEFALAIGTLIAAKIAVSLGSATVTSTIAGAIRSAITTSAASAAAGVSLTSAGAATGANLSKSTSLGLGSIATTLLGAFVGVKAAKAASNAVENGTSFGSELKEEFGLTEKEIGYHAPTTKWNPKANGGSVQTGDLFLANEKEPELIAHLGNRTQVANNDQITESIKVATMAGNAESTGLLRQAVGILNGILQKDNVVVAEVTTDSITNGLDRQNRRNGRTTVPIGV